jgi:hypothetical protein
MDSLRQLDCASSLLLQVAGCRLQRSAGAITRHPLAITCRCRAARPPRIRSFASTSTSTLLQMTTCTLSARIASRRLMRNATHQRALPQRFAEHLLEARRRPHVGASFLHRNACLMRFVSCRYQCRTCIVVDCCRAPAVVCIVMSSGFQDDRRVQLDRLSRHAKHNA